MTVIHNKSRLVPGHKYKVIIETERMDVTLEFTATFLRLDDNNIDLHWSNGVVLYSLDEHFMAEDLGVDKNPMTDAAYITALRDALEHCIDRLEGIRGGNHVVFDGALTLGYRVLRYRPQEVVSKILKHRFLKAEDTQE